MKFTRRRYTTEYDLSNCDEEPLWFIRSCQSHATVIVLYADTLKIKAVSENCLHRFGRGAEGLVGADAGAILGQEALSAIQGIDAGTDFAMLNPIELTSSHNGGFSRENLIVHRQGDLLILEIEPRDPEFGSATFLKRLDVALTRMQSSAQQGGSILSTTVDEVKAITGYDRVWLYRFDEEYNGEVIAEAKNDDLDPYLHLRYPHTDIPKQARDLYLRQQVRIVGTTQADADHLLLIDDDQPINLSDAANRAVSPIHLEYLRAINVGASLSIAVTVENRLWGLISCHHGEARVPDYRLRQMLAFFGRIVSGHLALRESSTFQSDRLRSNLVRAQLVERMQDSDNLAEPLRDEQGDLLRLVGATGAAIILDDRVDRIGDCPEPAEVRQIIDFLAERPGNIYSTAELYNAFPAARGFSSAPAGLLSIRITINPAEYILWFRPEEVTTINWGGRPEHRKLIQNGEVRLHPQMSFAKYVETKRGKARGWDRYQVDSATALRSDIKEVILTKYNDMRNRQRELADAYEELESFSYTVSHDLRAPLRGIKGFAEILQEDYVDNLDDWGQQALSMIIDNVTKMNDFINGILAFSRMGKQELVMASVELPELIREAWQDVPTTERVRLNLQLEVTALRSDPLLLKQVFHNLLSNSVKYRRRDVDTIISIRSRREDDNYYIEVEDNGIGFDMKYAANIFTVFHRLVSEEEYEGTGVGLAIVQRIIDKHNGAISVVSAPGVGTTFTIRLPL